MKSTSGTRLSNRFLYNGGREKTVTFVQTNKTVFPGSQHQDVTPLSASLQRSLAIALKASTIRREIDGHGGTPVWGNFRDTIYYKTSITKEKIKYVTENDNARTRSSDLLYICEGVREQVVQNCCGECQDEEIRCTELW